MKKIISLLLVFTMILSITVPAFAEDDTNSDDDVFNIPITTSVSTLNSEGEEESYFAPGDTITFRYEILPQDINLNELPIAKPVDIMLVADTSGSMAYDSGLTYDNWVNANYLKSTNLENWLSYNKFSKVIDGMEKWIADNSEIQTEDNYNDWKSINAASVSFARWKSQYATAESDSDWMERLNFKQESFEEWMSNSYNNIQEISLTSENVLENSKINTKYDYWINSNYTKLTDYDYWIDEDNGMVDVRHLGNRIDFYYNGKKKKFKNIFFNGEDDIKNFFNTYIKNKYYVNGHYYTKDELVDKYLQKYDSMYVMNENYYYYDQLEETYENDYEGKYFYNINGEQGYFAYNDETYKSILVNNPKQYTFGGTTYTLSELNDLFTSGYSNLLYLVKNGQEANEGEVVSEEVVQSYWESAIKGKYLYDGDYLTYSEMEDEFEEQIKKYSYNGGEYTYTYLNNHFNSTYKNNYYDLSGDGNALNDDNYKSSSELSELWDSLAERTRIGAAKTALNTFVDRMVESDMSDKVNIGIVDFDSYAKLIGELTNVHDNSSDLYTDISPLDASGGTNSGDGLRVAATKLTNAEHDKYIIFLSDGQASAYSYVNWDYNKDGYYDDYSYNAGYYDYYFGDYITSSTEEIEYVGNYDMGDYDIETFSSSSVGDDSDNYTQSVATSNISDKDITTYVIGVGDSSNSAQRTENENLTRNANYGRNNSSDDISNLYYSVNDASQLDKLYDSLAKEIINKIPVDNINMVLPFMDSQNITFNKSVKSKSNINSIKVNGEEVINNSASASDEIYFSILDNGDGSSSVNGKLPNFTYVLDETDEIYRAEPMIIDISVKLADDMEDGVFGINSSGIISYDVTYDGKVEKQEKPLSEIICTVMEGMKPVGIYSELDVINNGSSGNVSSALINITPDDEYNAITIYYGDNDEYSIPVREYSDTKYSEDVITVDLTDEYSDILNSGYKFKIKTLNKVYVESSGKYIDREGEEFVDLLKINSPEYIGENRSIDTKREVALSFNGEENLKNFSYGIDGDMDSYTPNYENNVYSNKDNSMLSKGSRSITFSAFNRNGNKTTVTNSEFIHAKRPSINPDSVIDDAVTFELTTFDNATLSEGNCKVIYKDDSENPTLTKELSCSLTGSDMNYVLTADLDGASFTGDAVLQIEVIDNYKNVGVIGDENREDEDDDEDDDDDEDEEIEDEVTPGSFQSILAIGLYDLNKGNFFKDIAGRDSNVVKGTRYTYAVKLKYSGQEQLFVGFDNLELYGIDCKIEGTQTVMNLVNVNDNIIINGLKDKLTDGEEYNLLINLIFNSDDDSIVVDSSKVFLDTGNPVIDTVDVSDAPDLE